MKPASKGKKVQEKKSQEKMIRYAVVGLGYFAG
jgi:hypothetical protein